MPHPFSSRDKCKLPFLKTKCLKSSIFPRLVVIDVLHISYIDSLIVKIFTPYSTGLIALLVGFYSGIVYIVSSYTHRNLDCCIGRRISIKS